MRRLLLASMTILLLPGSARAQSTPCTSSTCFYVFTSVCSACMIDRSLERLYDDGLHGDGAAGDSLYGVDIVVDQPAGVYYWTIGTMSSGGYPNPMFPYCACRGSIWSVRLWTSGPGDVIHFAFDQRRSGGWIPVPGVACSRGRSTNSPMAVVADPNLLTSFDLMGVKHAAAIHDGRWEAVVTIPSIGTHTFAFVGLDASVIFTDTYNSPCTCTAPTFRTSVLRSDVLFQFDESTGRMRAVVLGATPAAQSTWGSLKTRYR